jgi:probable rRNA maturation factor
VIYTQVPESISTEEALTFEGAIERAAQETLRFASAQPDAELSIVITNDRQLHDLNLQFLGIDAPTDVLSFPVGEAETDPDTGEVYLGDVLISLERARAQATSGGHPILDELQLLVIHGVLHLLGYDHAEEAEKAEMWSAQAEILTRLEVSTRPPE